MLPQKRFTRQEQHHKVRRVVELGPIPLGRQLLHMRTHLRGMSRQPSGSGAFVTGSHRFEIRGQRRLGVHHDPAITRQSHDQVRSLHTRLAAHRHLWFEVTVGQHAGQFTHPPQLQFAPLPTHTGARKACESCCVS